MQACARGLKEQVEGASPHAKGFFNKMHESIAQLLHFIMVVGEGFSRAR